LLATSAKDTQDEIIRSLSARLRQSVTFSPSSCEPRRSLTTNVRHSHPPPPPVTMALAALVALFSVLMAWLTASIFQVPTPMFILRWVPRPLLCVFTMEVRVEVAEPVGSETAPTFVTLRMLASSRVDWLRLDLKVNPIRLRDPFFLTTSRDREAPLADDERVASVCHLGIVAQKQSRVGGSFLCRDRILLWPLTRANLRSAHPACPAAILDDVLQQVLRSCAPSLPSLPSPPSSSAAPPSEPLLLFDTWRSAECSAGLAHQSLTSVRTLQFDSRNSSMEEAKAFFLDGSRMLPHRIEYDTATQATARAVAVAFESEHLYTVRVTRDTAYAAELAAELEARAHRRRHCENVLQVVLPSALRANAAALECALGSTPSETDQDASVLSPLASPASGASELSDVGALYVERRRLEQEVRLQTAHLALLAKLAAVAVDPAKCVEHRFRLRIRLPVGEVVDVANDPTALVRSDEKLRLLVLIIPPSGLRACPAAALSASPQPAPK